mgnify:CR=1 FL=1
MVLTAVSVSNFLSSILSKRILSSALKDKNDANTWMNKKKEKTSFTDGKKAMGVGC